MSSSEAPMRELNFAQALSEAVVQAMEEDDTVVVLGEDMRIGGVWGNATGAFEKFGAERVIDTPISEAAFIGAAMGMSFEGLRPIVDLMYADFFGVCMDQVYNHLAKAHYRSNGQLRAPVTVTTAIGAGLADGPMHSQAVYGAFAHLPGMKVVVPARPYDAKGLLMESIRYDGPVIFMHHKGVLGTDRLPPNPRARGEVPSEPYGIPLGKARVARAGVTLSIVTIGKMVHLAEDAADQLADEGIEAEVLDLRCLVPLDLEAILATVRKTGRLLVVDEDYQSFGMSGEVIACATEHVMRDLLVPPVRIAEPNVPVAFGRELERAQIPQVEQIVAAARAMAA